MHDTYDETTSVRDSTLPLGEFLDEQLARARENEIIQDVIIDDSDDENSPNDYVLPVVPEGYVMNEEAARAIFACNDRYDLKKLLAKWKQQSLNARMKPDPAFATSPICVTNKDYEFSVDPEIITLVESDPFYGLESETIVAYLTKLNDIATQFTHCRCTRVGVPQYPELVHGQSQHPAARLQVTAKILRASLEDKTPARGACQEAIQEQSI